MPLATNEQLADISCTTASACTAVGASVPRSEPVSSPIAWRWNGTNWSQQSISGFFGISGLVGVNCPALRKCFAVGHTGDVVVIERWNGTGWKRQR